MTTKSPKKAKQAVSSKATKIVSAKAKTPAKKVKKPIAKAPVAPQKKVAAPQKKKVNKKAPLAKAQVSAAHKPVSVAAKPKSQNKAPACKKCFVATLLLCFFLGTLGAHRFYTGHTLTAVLMLLLTLSCYGVIISAVWTLVDFVTIACGQFKTAQGERITYDK